METLSDKSAKRHVPDTSFNYSRRHTGKNLVSSSHVTLDYYLDTIKSVLMGWQPKVIILHRFVQDLRKELKKSSITGSSGNLQKIDRLLARDIDYVTDSEYISCIKFILEQWQTDLILKKTYIFFVYEKLQLKKEPFENQLDLTK